MTARIQDYDYPLPPELVAQYPLPQRDTSRLLVLEKAGGKTVHAHFRDLPLYLDPGDLVVVNDTRVFPARLKGTKTSGGQIELLLHHLPETEAEEEKSVLGEGARGRRPTYNPLPNPLPQPPYRGLGGEFEEKNVELPPPAVQSPQSKAARAQATYRGRLKVGQTLNFGPSLQAEIISLPQPGVAEVRFWSLNGEVCRSVLQAGEVPLPPYIRRPADAEDRQRYQTTYAARPGAIAAPTAGLHFTDAVMHELSRREVEVVSITLHVGLGTFSPVRHSDYTKHRLEPEYFELPAATAARLNEARALGKRLVAVGTTTTRVLEFCANPEGFKPQQGWCDLYIYPGYRFQAVDRLLTNFHLPRSTLLLLVSAFAGRNLIMTAYREAIKEKYRFYSYGDCMLIL
ncbi:MAG: tRNA preQ1(34) S-adenosylmethionine ribosyltransferase-isomerase QueA [Desulfobaccales bacterium]|nr:tRNA preQ1(34) S-adenosylmethionine ribosyltransferase-isomerase QueA [Desulfobaccales bacterium]